MSRWPPDAANRLAEAALGLYTEQGYEQTTVAAIAGRAGLTERTFFRHYPDKREVLFAGAAPIAEQLTDTLAVADPQTDPVAAAAAALVAAAEIVGRNRDHSRQRQRVIDANPVLQERELAKLASWATILAAGLQERGLAEPDARLVAETGVAVFRVAFVAWLTGDEDDLADLVRTSFGRLVRLSAGSAELSV